MFGSRPALAAVIGLSLAGGIARAAPPADLILTDARIYTADAGRREAAAMAVREGRIVYVGDAAGVRAFSGPKTRVVSAHGRRVLPGLVDAHIHATGIVEVPACDLASRPIDLDALPALVRDCISRFHIASGDWVAVQQWNFSEGNRPSATNPNLRAALDHASTDHPVVLMGNDGHHGAFNSRALAMAKDDAGKPIGFTRASLAGVFSDQAKLVGLDAHGDPDGTVNEDARDRMGAPDLITVNLPAIMRDPGAVTRKLNRSGITAIQDAWVSDALLPFYDALQNRGELTIRANLVLLYQPEAFRRADGVIDWSGLLSKAEAVRARYAASDRLRAVSVKIFADGVMEGNPYADPPTLPESPSLKPYLQPVFAQDAHGALTVKGYVDPDSPDCVAARSAMAKDPAAFSGENGAAFKAAHGYHPAQCVISHGRFQHDPAVLTEYARRAHADGFALHIHAISDAAVRLAIDAIEEARAADGRTDSPDAIAHLQQVTPQDIARLGRDHIFTLYTYAWATVVPDYDLSVIPFVERVSGSGYAAFHRPDSAYERAFYPARSTRNAGAPLAAGSDAPVGVRDPQPFVNMQVGVMRSERGWPAANPWERLTIRDLIDAYTRGGAQAMGRSSEFGSLEVGKSADFVVLDQDIVKLGDAGEADRIGRTQVLQTWFKGAPVWSQPGHR